MNGKKPTLISPGIKAGNHQMNMEPLIKTAFQNLQNENKKLAEAFNTIRHLLLGTIYKFGGPEHEVVLSAFDLNSIAEDLKFLTINIENRALTNEVYVRVNRQETTQVMSVEPSPQGELALVDASPEVTRINEDVPPVDCECGHYDNKHIGMVGVCKVRECACTEFNPKPTNMVI